MRYRLLGPLEVRHGATPAPLGGLRRRAVLGLLLLHRNEHVAIDQLIDAVWETGPPTTARQSVQNSIAALRRALTDGPADAPPTQPLRTRRHGYELCVEPGEVDIDRFRAMVDAAQTRLADDDVEPASAMLHDALALWHGPPLADLAAAGFTWALRNDLIEEQLHALELRIATDLALGRHGQLVAELEQLVERHPLRERFIAQQMTALYRSGRQAEALARYQSTRAMMVTGMGVEPGDDLQRLHRAILMQSVAPPPSPPRTSPATDQYGARRRVVTVLLAAVDRWKHDADDTDPERFDARTSARVAVVRDAVERFGGALCHVLGVTVLAVFGAQRAHEDDPRHALLAALAIADHPEVGPTAHLAVATGPVLVTTAAAPSTAGVTGQAVTTASALLEMAGDRQVLTTAETARASRGGVTFHPVRDGDGDGERDGRPLPSAFEVVDATPRRQLQGDAAGPLTGRDAELATLRDHIDRTWRQRRAQLVTIIGDLGSGKTRLVTAARHRDDAMVWRIGRAPPDDQATTFGPLADIVRSQAGIRDDDTQTRATDKLRTAVAETGISADEQPLLVRQLQSLIGGELNDQQDAQHRTGALSGWIRFLRYTAARTPLVLVFEDLHHADDVVLDVVHELAERLGSVPALILALARTELLDRRPAWSVDSRATNRLRLGALTDEATGALLRGLFAAHGLAERPTAQLVERIGGNPLFAEEYVRMLAAVGGYDDDPLTRCLRRLEHRDLLQQATPSQIPGEPEFTFIHGVVREVAYERIPLRGRVHKHRRAAAWIAALPAQRVGDRAGLLAFHLRRSLESAAAVGLVSAELVSEACAAMRTAGDRAAQLGAHRTAARWYGAALEWWPDDADRAEVLFGLAAARFHQDGEDEQALAAARDALLVVGHVSRAAEAEVLIGHAAWRHGRDDRQAYARAAAMIAREAPSPAKAFVLSRSALRFAIDDDAAAALRVGREALHIARRLRLPDHEAKAAMAIGMARIARGDERGLADLAHAVSTVADAALPLTANALINQATMLARLGHLDACFAAQLAARVVAQRFELTAELQWLEAERAYELYWRGHTAAAVDLARAFVATSADGARHYLEPICRVLHARTELVRGHNDRALVLSADAVRRARDAGDVQVLLPALALRARTCAVAGRSAEAGALADEVLAGLHGKLLLPEIGVNLAVALVATGDARRRLDAAGLTASAWLSATRAYVHGDHVAAARRYRRIGSVPDTRTAVAEGSGR